MKYQFNFSYEENLALEQTVNNQKKEQSIQLRFPIY